MHLFHFVTRLLGNMVTLEAFEVKDGQSTGYQFQMIGDPEEDMFALLGRMVVDAHLKLTSVLILF